MNGLLWKVLQPQYGPTHTEIIRDTFFYMILNEWIMEVAMYFIEQKSRRSTGNLNKCRAFLFHCQFCVVGKVIYDRKTTQLIFLPSAIRILLSIWVAAPNMCTRHILSFWTLAAHDTALVSACMNAPLCGQKPSGNTINIRSRKKTAIGCSKNIIWKEEKNIGSHKPCVCHHRIVIIA